jgi:glycosyltransferase involved in cell wall biosynthesis
MTESQLPLVSVLFITYKRFDLLEQSFRAFRENTDYPSLELVIADDGSGPEIQNKIRKLPANVFALLPQNRGLGANNNNGLRHCTGKYILMIQDDCICRGPRDYLRNTVLIMEANPEIGIVNYCGAPHPIDQSRMLAAGSEPCYITPKPYEDGIREYFLYTDQPHVVSRAALEHVGYYLELRDMEECERDYNRRWRDQSHFATGVIPAYYKKLYVHQGADLSFRTSRFRYKVQRALQPLKPALEGLSPALFRRAKSLVNWTLRCMERIRMVR